MLVLMKNPPLDPSALGSDGLPFRRRVVVRLEMAAWRGRQRELPIRACLHDHVRPDDEQSCSILCS